MEKPLSKSKQLIIPKFGKASFNLKLEKVVLGTKRFFPLLIFFQELNSIISALFGEASVQHLIKLLYGR